MSWFKQNFGLDWVDVAVQAVVTGILAGALDTLTPGPRGDTLILFTVGASVILFAVRRTLALRRVARDPIGLSSGEMAAERFQDLEQRVVELEAAGARMAELEERLDFAERLLAQQTEKPPALLQDGGPRG